MITAETLSRSRLLLCFALSTNTMTYSVLTHSYTPWWIVQFGIGVFGVGLCGFQLFPRRQR